MAALRAALRSDFFRHISVLMGGTIVAQFIPLLVLPILSRSYTPEIFAVLALMMMGAYFTASLSTGNFEQAIPTARSLHRARTLATITMLVSIAFAIAYSALLLALYSPIAQLLHLGAHAPWMFAVPFSLLCGSFAAVGNYWLLRAGKPARQSGIKLVHASVNALLAVIFGLLHVADGLIYAFVLGVASSAVWGLYWSWRSGLRLVHLHTVHHLLRTMHHYRQFVLLGAVPTALSNLAIQIPLMLVTAYFSLTTTGHFSITRNLLTGGLTLVATCIGQVLLKHLTARMHAKHALWPLFVRVMLVTGALGVLGGASLYFFGPWFFALYLGQGWADSGQILQALAVSSPLVLMGASLAPALVATHQLRLMARWQVCYVLASASLFFFVHLPFEQFMWRIVGMECVAYGLYVPLIAYAIRRHDANR